ncbi:hypothetical protein [Aggregatilinea lenta]|uniref:hypothetical protein n=1 Tax=Aggregatilinea lenta TaxID=913108 RepID=UPI000E5B0381|nr:hypothetical protein [Aggregatilinea lenta]
MHRTLAEAFETRWKALRRELADLKTETRRASRQARAEVAASVPVYASSDDLPPAGQAGRLAVVGSTLYVDTGTTWRGI